MKKKLLPGLIIALGLLTSACHTDSGFDAPAESFQKESQAETVSPAEEKPAAKDQSSDPADHVSIGTEETKDTETAFHTFSVKALNHLNADPSLISNRYVKADDIRTAISFSLAQDWKESDSLTCHFQTQDSQYESSWNGTADAVINTESGTMTYKLIPEFFGTNQKNGTCEITFHLDETVPYIAVEGDPRLEGEYYSFQDSFSRPDEFTRYLGKADLYLYPTEDLKLLRNEIYAAHGRKFDTESLNQYFSAQAWYRGLLEPNAFSDAMLSDIEKKNITLIRELEEIPYNERNTIDGIQYGDEWNRLPVAPYLSYLHPGHETGLSADLSKAEDMGVYYCAPGSISIPASITQEQFSQVQNGGEVELVLNALTGKSRMLSLNPNAGPSGSNGYLTYDKGMDPSTYGNEAAITADLENGTYTLWEDSDDTIMKTVYEGNIYILKGAVTGTYTNLAEASKTQKEIYAGEPVEEGEEEASAEYTVYGNDLYYNEKGYFTAFYYLGD